MVMLEKEIEKKLRTEVVKMGGLALKFASPGMAGVPDRLLLLPNGRIFFAETKKPGGKMRPLQLKRKSQLEALGFQVFCIDSIEAVRRFADAIRTP